MHADIRQCHAIFSNTISHSVRDEVHSHEKWEVKFLVKIKNLTFSDSLVSKPFKLKWKGIFGNAIIYNLRKQFDVLCFQRGLYLCKNF